MTRAQIAAILSETASLLELKGENPFKVRAYANAARAIEGLAEEPSDRAASGTLAEIRGIGPALASHIAELLATGDFPLHAELKASFPIGVLELFRIEGLGPKRIRTLFEEHGIDSPAKLEEACRAGTIAILPGFGEKTQEKLLSAIANLQRYSVRHLLPAAEAAAASVLAALRSDPDVRKAESAGSLRRRRESIGDLDFVAAVEPSCRAAVGKRLISRFAPTEILGAGETKVSFRLPDGLQVDVRLVDDLEFASALLHFTGSKEHNVRLRTRAKERGWTLNEYGLFHGTRRLRAESEEALYKRLGLVYVAPEMREGLEEIELAEKNALPELVELKDLRGTLHVHTDASDGKATLEEMVDAARTRGWEYLGIADHSRSAAYAGGLTPERVRAQFVAIDRLGERIPGFRIFKGTECDILADGTLDFPDELLLEFDFVVVSVHSRFTLPKEKMTERIARAVSHPAVTFLGHATGRLLLAREPYAFDLDAVFDAAEKNGVIIEVNANPHRLDLDWRDLRGWLARGQSTSIHPDAHSTQGLDDVRFGVDVARKAGATAGQILNTYPAARLDAYFAARRERARAMLVPGKKK